MWHQLQRRSNRCQYYPLLSGYGNEDDDTVGTEAGEEDCGTNVMVECLARHLDYSEKVSNSININTESTAVKVR